MNFYQAIFLGAVQGLTEFLPVSSSGHLVLGQHLLGLREPQLMFDVAVHVGTLAAVLIVFRDDLLAMIRGLWAGDDRGREGRRLIMLVAVGSVPTALMGFLLKDFFESLFASVAAVGAALLFTGCLLMLTRLASGRGLGLSEVGPGRALLIGLAQGVAITPGVSRSGSTIAVGLLLGLERQLAARLSFLLFIPAISGALLLQLLDAEASAAPETSILLAGALTAGLVGYVCLRLLLRVVNQGKISYFAYYCWALGLAALAWTTFGN
ncbi:Bacitracin resistance protein BacA [Desulfarculus baarsii DSM 2075]|uniref:Undecaprenyl-diphosphatase n=1 Tax=Desulfarculus baarsii (strain ATCC 33931 / DSM 2075 / LMG 7858 / VKM B-1802 / 2st14) TaxID=644282 RepID=E1QKG0_DESB2|nr:undecaprenyl-diphosphate phosphatase [Desulfarculus baarsii]ADK86053.1 Bacitracin resistance protein BacA [Desulfarculus baarsii DSM 2075]